MAGTRRNTILGITLIAILGALLVWRYLPALRAPLGAPPIDITKVIPPTGEGTAGDTPPDFPLHLPPGFTISLFAKNLPGARVMALDQFGNLWVSQTSEGVVSLLEINNGTVRSQHPVFRDLQKPHGLAFDPTHPGLLYIAEEHRVRRVTTYSDDPGEQVIALPSGDGHFTRTLGFGPDGKLYVSVGSSCNVCNETDDRRAAILRVDPETKQNEVYARGLRNAVFFAWNRGVMWATEMGRDWLGNNMPPDEINIVEQGNPSTALGINNYGWPNCYGRNIHDTDFDTKTYIRNPCMEPFEKPATIDVPAHSAPLGLAFIPDSDQPGGRAWPEEYRGDLLVAYHGSWNRTEPTGYKVVRHRFQKNDKRAYTGVEDFITGWLIPSKRAGTDSDGALGRPVALLFLPDGSLLLSDDKAGAIYRITPPEIR